MKRKIGVVTALAVLAANAGISTPVLSQQTEEFLLDCDIYLREEDRSFLQDELARLLVEDPNNICIDVIVGALGGSPVAQVLPPDPY